MAKRNFFTILDEKFLKMERDFFRTHGEQELLPHALDETMHMAGSREGTDVYMEVRFHKEDKYQWLAEQQKDPLFISGEIAVFIFGERPVRAKEQLQKYNKAPTSQPNGVRIFQLLDQCCEHPEVVWDVQISVIHPSDKANLIAEGLEVAFRSLLLSVPYGYKSITHSQSS